MTIRNAAGDLRFAQRTLRRAPSFTLAAVSVLALGIGATTAIFTLIDKALLAPLPYREAERIVQMWMTGPDGGGGVTLSVPEIALLRRQEAILQDAAAYDFGGPGINLTGGGDPEQVKGIHVSAAYFRLFGAQAAIGRTFTREEDQPGGGRVAVLSHGLWQQRYGGDPALVGRTISLGHEAYTVVGVLGPDFRPDPPAQIWLPLQADMDSTSQAHYLRAAARLRPGVTLAQANAGLKVATAEFLRAYPLFNQDVVFTAKPIRETTVGEVRAPLWTLFGAVTLVLLIACSTVANLLLARANTRHRELTIRAALGATRGRIVAQLLMESLLLALCGGALGLAIGSAALRVLLTLRPDAIPVTETGLDGRMVAFAIAASAATAVVFGLIPALRSARGGLAASMNAGQRTGAGRSAVRVTSSLVVAQVALAVLLVFGAGLLLRNFAALRSVEPGLDPQGVLTLAMSLEGTRFRDTASVNRMVEDGVERLGRTPGVLAAATTWTLPLEVAFGSSIFIEGRPLPGDSKVHGLVNMRPVSPDYFAVYRIPLRQGRVFTTREAGSVAMISAEAARKYWPDGDALGQRITIDKYMGPDFAAPPREIIGVVGDVRDRGLGRETGAMVYVPQALVPDGMTRIDAGILPLTWVVRTQGDPSQLHAAIRRELRAASGGLAVAQVRTMREVVRASTARSDFQTLLLVLFALAALLLAAAGTYSLMNYSVEERRREIGVRLALGAMPAAVRNMVVRRGLTLAAAGVAIGLAASVAMRRAMGALFFGLGQSGERAADPAMLVASAAVLAAVALAAAYVPARRAAGINPAETLRGE
ncbi:MAG: ABC transporter permease [Bryobacteraceae bacterium]